MEMTRSFSIDTPNATMGKVSISSVAGRLTAELPWSGDVGDSPEVRYDGRDRDRRIVPTASI